MNDKAGRKEWIGLAVLALPSLLVSIDIFVLLLALPRLTADLHASGTEQLWILDSYGFLLSGFLITMGTLGDRIGRRKLLLAGAAAFGAASVLAAYATSPAMLIAARALLGVAGATLTPSTLALITNMFRNPKERPVAIGVWLMSLMGGIALGPVVGGALLEHFWWGSVFLLGVPAMVLLLVLGPVLLPEYKAPHTGRIDLASVALSLAAILPAVWGLKELARNGLAAAPLAALAAGTAVGFLFVRRQVRLPDPLLDLRLFADRAFTAALVCMLVNTMLPGATMVLITQYLQLVEGLSPLRAGLWLLPTVAAAIATLQVSPLLARRVPPARLIAGGLVVSASGLVLLTQTPSSDGLAYVVTGLALINLGAGPLLTLGTNLVVGAAPPEKAGSAASISQTSNEFGFALGIATMGSLASAVYHSRIGAPDGVPEMARDTLAGASTAAADLPAQVGTALLESARAAFTAGLATVAGISAALVLGTAVLILVAMRHIRPVGEAPDPRDQGVPEGNPNRNSGHSPSLVATAPSSIRR
jgi:DHA2 family multidrug resistance protein-like MFS transporter